jgi:hypothetical protein
VPLIFLVIAWLVNLFLSLCGGNMSYLSNQHTDLSLSEMISRVRQAAPEIGFNCRCWHTETRTRTVRDSKGNTRRETYTETVTTYRESQGFNFSGWDDISGNLLASDVTFYPLTKVKCDKRFVFTDEKTRLSYDAIGADLYNRNRFRDVHCDVTPYFKIAGFKSRLLCVDKPSEKPVCLSPSGYALTTVLCLNWLFDRWFQNTTVKGYFTVVKRITLV